ncbi:hypothetical protein [Paracraurococcus lichenis]|uniref:Uncharacterized protein n=1 Tax=Paracraurococcus lichenis TaxID=3064888 RepID=A0ABT9E9J9_9PROT|nr:hypothetical protein [Paracraurococcus sp. LOR1-02]MDO9712886.1 hypothetical protein [Paracraurococcus sp. LOR1-02]
MRALRRRSLALLATGLAAAPSTLAQPRPLLRIGDQVGGTRAVAEVAGAQCGCWPRA